MEKFKEWLDRRLDEGQGDVRQIELLKLDPQGFMHFKNAWDGRQGTSSRIMGAKVVSDMGGGDIVLLQISTESGTRYMAKVPKMVANQINKMGMQNSSGRGGSKNAQLGDVSDHPLYGKPTPAPAPVMNRKRAQLGDVSDHPLYGKPTP